MKKVIVTLCLVALAASAYVGPAYAEKTLAPKVSHLPAPIPAHKKVTMIFTSNSTSVAYIDQITKPIPAKTGYMFMALSSSEHLEFQDGKIIRYTNVEITPEPAHADRKAFFKPDIAPRTSGGGIWDGDSVSFFIRTFDSVTHTDQKPLDAAALTIKVDGKECKVTYAAQEKNYSLRCK